MRSILSLLCLFFLITPLSFISSSIIYTYTDPNCQTLGPPSLLPSRQQTGIYAYINTWPTAFCVDQMDGGMGLSTALANPDGNGNYQKANSVFVNCFGGSGQALVAWWNIYTPNTNPNNPHPQPQPASFANRCMNSPEAMSFSVSGHDNTCFQVTNAGVVQSMLVNCNHGYTLSIHTSLFVLVFISTISLLFM